MPDVVISFATAGEANVVRAWVAQAAAVRAHNQDLRAAYEASMRTDNSLKSMTAAGAKGMRAVGGEIKSLALGIIGGGGILGAFQMWKTANAEILQQAHETTLAYDALFRKFNIQSGLRGLAGSEAKETLLDVAHERAVPEEVAAKAATQLVSSGYDVKEVVQGGAANEFLQGMNAMNQRGAGVDATSLGGAAASFQTAMGVEKNADGMRQTMSSLFAAFQGTNIQLPDLQQYAAKAGGMKGKLSFQELIAAGSIHRDLGIASSESASGLEGLVGQAGTAGSSSGKVAALKQIGLQPEDIDFIGENLDTVLGRLEGGLNTIPEEEREGVIKQVFEQAGVKFLKPLLAGRKTISDRVTAMGESEAGYSDAVKEAEEGPGAVKVRQDIEKNRRRERQNKNQVEVLNELVGMAEERGESPARIALSKQAFDGSLNTTGDLDTAGRAFTNISGLEHSDYTESKKRLKEKGLKFDTFGDKPEQPTAVDLKNESARLDRLKTQRDNVKTKLDEDSTPGIGERFGLGGGTERQSRIASGVSQVTQLDALIAALEANTAATQQNSKTSASGDVERPPTAPASTSLAN